MSEIAEKFPIAAPPAPGVPNIPVNFRGGRQKSKRELEIEQEIAVFAEKNSNNLDKVRKYVKDKKESIVIALTLLDKDIQPFNEKIQEDMKQLTILQNTIMEMQKVLDEKRKAVAEQIKDPKFINDLPVVNVDKYNKRIKDLEKIIEVEIGDGSGQAGRGGKKEEIEKRIKFNQDAIEAVKTKFETKNNKSISGFRAEGQLYDKELLLWEKKINPSSLVRQKKVLRQESTLSNKYLTFSSGEKKEKDQEATYEPDEIKVLCGALLDEVDQGMSQSSQEMELTNFLKSVVSPVARKTAWPILMKNLEKNAPEIWWNLMQENSDFQENGTVKAVIEAVLGFPDIVEEMAKREEIRKEAIQKANEVTEKIELEDKRKNKRKVEQTEGMSVEGENDPAKRLRLVIAQLHEMQGNQRKLEEDKKLAEDGRDKAEQEKQRIEMEKIKVEEEKRKVEEEKKQLEENKQRVESTPVRPSSNVIQKVVDTKKRKT